MYYNNQFNRYNNRKNDRSYSVRFARQLGIMLIVFIFLLLVKFVVNDTTQKINLKFKEVFYNDLTNEATEVFKSKLGESGGFLSESPKNKDSEFSIEFLPAEGKITTVFGKTINPTTKKEEVHNGIELEVKDGADIKCVFDGAVESVDLDTAKGNTVTISHDGGLKTIYRYLTDLSIQEGDSVEKGKVMGKVFKAKNAKAASLYFELQKGGIPDNPEKYMKALTN